MTTEQIAKLVEQAVMRERRRCASLARLAQDMAFESRGREPDQATRVGWGMVYSAMGVLQNSIKSGAVPHEAK